jgi:flagellum-specific ATP synthase
MSSLPDPQTLQRVDLFERIGRVVEVHGQSIEAEGPDAFLGEICTIHGSFNQRSLQAEVVGFRAGRVCLTPFSDPQGISVGSSVVASGHGFMAPVGDQFLGRVVDAMGQPLDGKPAPLPAESRPLHVTPRPVMSRRRIDAVMETGVKAIDAFLPLGRGQRIGLFAGSGVGKSTLMGMVTNGIQADVNIVALIGERGREVREFVEDHLGAEGLKRAVVVVATADAPAVMRLNAAYYATVLAEYFRDQGRSVLLTLDSLTRLAMARREIGLSSGEPPTSRGYTPSVFSEIPALCERCGTADGEGSITGIYTVLVEGDDFNEPGRAHHAVARPGGGGPVPAHRCAAERQPPVVHLVDGRAENPGVHLAGSHGQLRAQPPADRDRRLPRGRQCRAGQGRGPDAAPARVPQPVGRPRGPPAGHLATTQAGAGMSPTLRSLTALKAMAAWEMGEAALTLSSALAAHQEVQGRAQAIEQQAQAIGQAYGRAAQPGQRLQLAAVSVLSRQASASLEVQGQVADELHQADERVQREREVLAQHRSRDESLRKVLRKERRREEAKRAKVQLAHLDELFLARRWTMEDGA